MRVIYDGWSLIHAPLSPESLHLLTILENLVLGPVWVRKTPKKEAEETAMFYLEKVKIAEQAQKFPGQLSGGQQQRVAIALALLLGALLVSGIILISSVGDSRGVISQEAPAPRPAIEE